MNEAAWWFSGHSIAGVEQRRRVERVFAQIRIAVVTIEGTGHYVVGSSVERVDFVQGSVKYPSLHTVHGADTLAHRREVYQQRRARFQRSKRKGMASTHLVHSITRLVDRCRGCGVMFWTMDRYSKSALSAHSNQA